MIYNIILAVIMIAVAVGATFVIIEATLVILSFFKTKK